MGDLSAIVPFEKLTFGGSTEGNKPYFQRGDLLGSGRDGVVYEYTFSSCEAYKMAVKYSNSTTHALKAFDREAAAFSTLGGHPNIVRLYNALKPDDKPLMMFEHCEGLFTRIVRRGPLEVDQVRKVARDVLKGLAHMHSKGVMHRDIKTENILLRTDGTAVIADFGIAKMSTQSRKRVGTAQYLAPEVAQNCITKNDRQVYNEKVDIWSVGCMILVMLTGKAFADVCKFNGVDTSEPLAIIEFIASIDENTVEQQLMSSLDNDSMDCYDFLELCFDTDPETRPSAAQLLEHHWIACKAPDSNAAFVRNGVEALENHGTR